ncbi:GIP [Symbiodinium sp. CCMP2592]|nr:GIP [Symbiodinium sp. CCMP2592]
MGVAIPDASILLKSVELITAKVMEGNGDIRFRLSLVKNDLQLFSRPTLESVIKYHSHALAEMQQAAPARPRSSPSSTAATASTTESLRLKAVTTTTAGTGESLSPGSSPTRKTGAKTPCKFFQGDAGCKRGSSGCKYDHTFESKEAKKQKCWECGATSHRRTDCPVAAKNGKGGRSSKDGNGPTTTAATTATSLAALAASQPPAPVASQQALLESIQQAAGTSSINSTTTTTGRETAAEDPRAQDVKALLEEANAMLSKLTKLATMKVCPDLKEISAGIERVERKDEERAALLDSGASHSFRAALDDVEERVSAPVRVELDAPDADPVPTILPLGAMVQQLGCELRWTRAGGLRVIHPQFGELKTFVKGNHPMLGETQALEIIVQLEDAKLKELESNVLTTAVNLMNTEEVALWDVSLARYAQTGQRAHALEALMFGTSPLGGLSEGLPAMMAPSMNLDNKSGWKYLKALPIKRATRKALMDKMWSVRCFTRDDGVDFKVLNTAEAVFVDVNVDKSKLFSLKGDSVMYKALMWAALRGQLEGLYGTAPTNHSEELRSKLLWIWMLASHANNNVGQRAPYLALGGKSLEHFGKSEQWKMIQHEYELRIVCTVAKETGNNYLMVTNLNLENNLGGTSQGAPFSQAWPDSVCHQVIQAIQDWRQSFHHWMLKKYDVPLSEMKEAEKKRWIRHIKNGHLPFEKRCRTCIETCATGRAHRRVVAPSCYVLSLDLCGPFRVRGEYAGSKDYKYALIGAYVMPKLSGAKDEKIPEYTPEEEEAFEEDDLMDEVGHPEEPLDPADEKDLKESKEKYSKLLSGVGELPEYQVLNYAIPLKTRLASEVDTAVKSLYLQLRAEGLPVTRVHSDRARELRGSALRSWLISRDVLPTCGESQVPQTNGRAEAAVKRAKRRTKALLMASGLPRACWPWAMTYSAFQQREMALGRGSSLLSFASPVHVKNKVFGTGHKFDLDNMWKEGVYVGPAPDIKGGHTVRFPEGRYVSSYASQEWGCGYGPQEEEQKEAEGEHNLPAEDSDPHQVPPGAYGAYGAFEGDELFPELAMDWKDGPVEVDFQHDLPAEDSGPHQVPPGLLENKEASVPSGVPEGEASVPSGVPSRRLTSKTGLRALRPLSEPEQMAEYLAEKLLGNNKFTKDDVLSLYVYLEKAKQLFSKSHGRKPSPKTTSWITGLFTHGGVCGLRDGALRMPAVTKYLATFAQKVAGIREFGAVGIVKNSGLGCHRDLHNHPHTTNAVYPLSEFKDGGIWVQGEAKEHEVVVNKQVKPGVWKQRDRVVLVTYHPRATNLRYGNAIKLQEMGFPLVAGVAEKKEIALLSHKSGNDEEKLQNSLTSLNEAHQQLLEDMEERAAALRLLLEEEQALADDLQEASDHVVDEAKRIAETIHNMIHGTSKELEGLDKKNMEACLKAAAVNQEPDYEAVIDNLQGDLQVVHTVPLEQVRPVAERWDAAIKKELDSLFGSGTLRRLSSQEAADLQRQGKLRLVPTKGVHTLKPPDVAGNRLRRRYRLVLCGNHAVREEGYGSLYAGGASIETFRAALCYGAARRWRGASSDISSAFLLAEWPEGLSQYAVQPPRFLVERGYASPTEVWLVQRPLYGLRESPSIWSACRTRRLTSAKIPYKEGHLEMKASDVDKEVWMVYHVEKEKKSLVALLVTYVDDLFFLGSTKVVQALDSWVREKWPCSTLQWADAPEGTRYLGTEVTQTSTGAFELRQSGYIRDLLGSHEMTEATPTQLPCPKEWVAEDVDGYVEEFNEDDLRMGQRMVGELLWLTMRSRPDLQFVVAHMSQWVSKHPKRVTRIAKRVLSYLSATVQMKLVIGDYKKEASASSSTTTSNPPHTARTDNTYTGDTGFNWLRVIAYSDASFAPTGSRSNGAALVTLNDSPIAWKATRQGMVTLSTMESELLEATQTAVLAEGIACLIDEFCGRRVDRVLRVDNAAATAMLEGGPGSWRTRHLRVRSAYVLQQVELGLLQIEFVEGRKQLADLGTKAHPKVRLWELLEMWGFECLPDEATQSKLVKTIMLCLLTLALKSVPVAEAAEKEPLNLAGVDELVLVVAVCCLGAVAIWEMVKWCGHCMWNRAIKGKKAQRLQRMRDLAKAAVETELDRAWDESHDVGGQTPQARVEGAMQGAMTRALDTAPMLRQSPQRSSSRPGILRDAGTQAEWRHEVVEPQAEYFRFEGPFYMTEHGKNVHVRQDCHGFRLASHRVKSYGFCDWCEGQVPLYIRRERGSSSSRRLG